MARRRSHVKSGEVAEAVQAQATYGSGGLMRQIPIGERPRDRLLRRGAQALSDAELLSVLLGNGCRETDLSHVLEETGGLSGLIEAEDQILHWKGIGKVRAATLLATREIACRMTRAKIADRRLLHEPEAVASYLLLRFSIPDQEVLGALYLDVQNRLIAEREIFRGTLSRTSVEPRQILKEALRHNASSFLLFHTHPSGDPSPSTEDLEFTRWIAKAGDIMGVRLSDHLILGSSGRWVSLKRRLGW
jgi:DNA repair protein RadC